jgi:hypothetical protein
LAVRFHLWDDFSAPLQLITRLQNQTPLLGSSAGILNATFHLRSNLSQILFLFRENAAELFPHKVKKPFREPHPQDAHPGHGSQHQHDSISHGENASRQRYADTRNQLKMTHTHHRDLDPEDMPMLFKTLAMELQKFLRRLNEFPEFNG